MDQSKTVVRHLQVATIWGVQIALYPVYLLIQTSRVVIQQLQESADKNSSRYLGNEEATSPSLPPEVDRPITKVLQLVEGFLNPEQGSNPLTFLPSQGNTTLLRGESKSQDLLLASPSSSVSFILSTTSIELTGEYGEQQPSDLALDIALDIEKSGIEDPLALRKELHFVVQGVASSIASKSLVLIDTNNQILDILTPEQQQKLAKKITWEVASYGYDRRCFLGSQRLAQHSANYQLPTPTSPRVFLPAKWFWRLMAWVQRGEVAIAADLFQESSLPRLAPITPVRTFLELPSFSLPPLSIAPETIQRIDQQIYQIELNQIVPASQWLNQVGEDLLPIIISPDQLIAQGKTAGVNTQGSAHLGNIWELIQGAIAYFFGKNSSRLPSNENNHQLGSEENNYLLDNLGQANYQNYQLYQDLLSGSAKPIPQIPISQGLISQTQQYQELLFSEDDWLTPEDLFQSPLYQLTDDYEDEGMIDLPSATETKLLGQSSYPPLAQVMAVQGRRPEKKPKFSAPKSPSSSKLSPPAKTRRSSPPLSNSNSSKLTSAASTSIRNQGDNKQNKDRKSVV